MARLTSREKLLLGVFTPLWVVCLSLHVREVVSTGIALPVVFASPSQEPGGHPHVGGFHLERDSRGTGLEVGDRLLTLGDVDLRGVGHIGFDAHAVEQAGSSLRAPLVIERDGERLERELELRPFAVPWFRIPFLFAGFGVAVFLLVRSPGQVQSQRLATGLMLVVVVECIFPGRSYLQTMIAWPIVYLGPPIAVFYLLRWAIGFPDGVPDGKRLSRAWPWVLLVSYLTPRLSFLAGGPVPPHLIPTFVHALDAVFFGSMIGVLAWNYLHAPAAGRRAIKWMIAALWAGGLPVGLVLAIPVFAPGLATFGELLGWAVAGASLAMLGLIGALVRGRVFDIDRVLQATATYTIALVAVLAGVLAVIPSLARAASSVTGVGIDTAQLALSLALAGLAVSTARRVRPSVDRVFFPERVAFEQGSEQLLRDLSDCRQADEVIRLVDERVGSLLRAVTHVAFVRDGDGFRSADHEDRDLRVPGDGPLVGALEANPVPVVLEDGRTPGDLPDPDARERTLLAASGSSVLIPIRCGKDLAAFVALGPKHSGDVYTATDAALLGTVAETASGRLLSIRDEGIIAQERTRAELLNVLKDEAERANLARSRFLAAASHDLRQPLHALGLFVEALEAEVQGGEARRLVDRVRASTASLTEMFDALLDVSRLDAGAVEARIADVDLGPLLARLRSEFHPQAKARGLELRVDQTEAFVRSDGLLLGRILGNLLTNAIRYTDEGSVSVGLRDEGDALRIEVRDTGPGIPAEQRQAIFDEFVQIEGRAHRRGLGLGLSIVDRLSRLLGHRLALESTPGEGSTFSVTVPRGTRPTVAASEVEEGASANELAGRHVLLIDDDPQILEGTRRMLERWAGRVTLADSARDALEKAASASEPPELILTDYRLGDGLTGLEAIADLRDALGADVPAAVITGETAPTTLAAIRERGFALLTKPIRPAKMRAVLTQLLRAD